MQIACPNCARVFDLDDERTKQVDRAKCLCGHAIELRPSLTQQQRLGKYMLQRRVAKGGMGEIFYAKVLGIEGFEREVAIKKMLPHLSADRDFVNMLVKEAKLTVLLNHPNIVQVYDLAREGEEYYIAMEYVPGINLGTLLEYCRAKNILLPVELVVHVMIEALKGLDYAHQLKGPDGQAMLVLHRDITPQNIMITQSGWVKVADFGIAKARNEISTTNPGVIKGKLGYLAPEQIAGLEADQRLDVFCAGIVTWELLAARRLFKGTDEIDTFRRVSEAKVPPFVGYRQDVSAPIEACIRKALAADRDQRFRTAREYGEGLIAALAPRTPEDCAKVAKAFLTQHAELFARVVEHQSAADTIDGPTVALTPQRPTQEVSVTDLEVKRAGKVRSRMVLLSLAALLIALLGFVVFLVAKPQPKVAALVASPLGDTDVQAAVDAKREAIVECYKSGAPKNTLQGLLVVANNGVVTRALVEPPDDEFGGRACVEQVLRNLALRPHSGPEFVGRANLPKATRQSPRDTPAAEREASKPSQALSPMTSAEIQRAVERSYTAIHSCLKQLNAASAPAALQVKLKVLSSGKVSDAVVSPPVREVKAERCLNKAFHGIVFRRSQKDFEFVLPLQLQRTENP